MSTGSDNRFLATDFQAEDEIRPVLAAYGPALAPFVAECLEGAGGFSGARLWRLSTPQGDLCLRRWPPEHPTPEQLTWIHSVLRAAAANGFQRLPVPLVTTNQSTWVRWENALWELAPWLSGRADYSSHPSPARLAAALQTLAEFHLSVADFGSPISGASPGIERRVQQLDRLLQEDFARIAAAVSEAPHQELQDPALQLLELFPRLAERSRRALQGAAGQHVALQPCLRDIWHDHVLFEVERVTGIVDFGAMRIDSVAGDIARLLGSLVGDDARGWQSGLLAYEQIRPLSASELSLIPVFDRSGILLGAFNWLDWIYLQGCRFSDLSAIRTRLEVAIGRLESN